MQPSQTYVELDLDALQREQEVIAAYPWWSEPETPRTDPAKILALVAELRAARKVVERARIRRNIHGKSNIRLIYEIDQAVEAFDNRE